MVLILFYTIRRAHREENPAEKRKHLFIGALPLMVSISGMVGEMINPYVPTFCYASMILMLIFYIASVELRVSQDPLTQLKEIPHNMDGSLAGDYQPSAACKFLDLPPVSLRNLQATAD